MESMNDKHGSVPEEEQKMSNIMQIFAVLTDDGSRKKFVSHGIPPSIYMQQMLLTTEERATSLMIQERGNQLIPGHPNSCFRVIPRIVIFQQFSPGNMYSVTLTVTNITAFPQSLKMNCTKNSWFKFECKDATYKRRLAPGMNMICDVKFFPDNERDYKYEAVFATSTETFAVPILAIGPRPLLDFPDSIEVPKTAVKILSVKHLLVRNIGNVPAVFSLSTNSPFTVHPRKGVLAEEETMQVTVNFLSEKIGFFKENLTVTYESGEIIGLNLCATAEHCFIRLERGSIRIEGTYLGLTRSKTFAIHNRGNYISNFRWVLYETSERDRLEQEKYKRSFEMVRNIEVLRKVDLEHYNICDPLLHEVACQRIYADELSCLTDQKFPFRHTNYRLIPLEGEIWPHSTVNITLIFEPDEVGVIDSKVYLEVTGCEERIPLNLHGVCIGPLIKLNVTCADLGCIFLCSVHNYEVICENKGDIPGTLIYSPRPADFGGKIDVNPIQVKLQPGHCKSFNLCFSSNRTGDFMERVDFVVKESLEVISLLIKGSVICPTLHFDKQNLDFGVTALGFTTKHDVCLHNSSLVPVTFCLTITQDGTQPALTHEDFARSLIKPSLVGNPKEFVIIPDEGVVAPHSLQRIKISYTPNVVRSSQTALRAEMWDSDSEPVTLPIIFSSKVASLIVKPSEILIRFCFINFPYTRSITVENKSDVEGYFYLPPQPVTISPTVIYSFSSHQGYLKPKESKSISLRIITTTLGRQKIQLSLLVFGDRNLTPCCSLICNGQGPIVTVQPTQLNWGEVRLLEEVKSTITLFSDSPIPAQFVAGLHKTPSPWTVCPASGALAPNKSLKLEITIHLRDTGKYSDKIDIEIMNGRVITCALHAVGIGTSIYLNPNMTPVFDMGLLFRDQDITIPITMINKGTRHHRLTWSTTEHLQAFQTSGTHEKERNKFTMDPHVVDLPSGAESIVHCTIRWGVNESLTEQWYFHGQIRGQGKRRVLGTSLFKAKFTDPNISFSKRKLTFRYDMSVSATKTRLIDTLFVMNRSGRDLIARANIDPPFEMIIENEEDGVQKMENLLLQDDVGTRICIRFDIQSIDLSDLYSRTFRGALTFDYEMHRTKDKLECIAEVNYPNISFSSTEPIILDCEVGSAVCKKLTLINRGHLPVRYSFEELSVDAVQLDTIMGEGSEIQDCSSILAEKELKEEEEEEEAPAEEPTIVDDEESAHKLADSLQVTAADVRNCIFPMIERYFQEDTEIPALKHLRNSTTDDSQHARESPAQILDLIPKEGTILPYSSQYVYFELNASQRTKKDAQIACRVESGPTEILNVRAIADKICYSIDKKLIDFHRQLIGESCQETLTIVNEGMVGFTFETHLIKKQIPDVGRLRVKPRCGVVNPMSKMCLDIAYFVDMPGSIHEQFDLEIAHYVPVSIHVKGYGSLPQVYLTVPRLEAFKRLPVEICYQSVGILTVGFLNEAPRFSFKNERDNIMSIVDKDAIEYLQMSDSESERLTGDGWEVISSGEMIPSVMDVEMAIERLLTIEYIQENPSVLARHDTVIKNRGISSLFVPEYIIDMGYAVIDRVSYYSAMLVNYGPVPVDVRVKKVKGKSSWSQKSGIIVQFDDTKELPVGETTPLNIMFHPRRSVYLEKRTDFEHTIYLEVTHGATIPISVRAVATYPFLTVHTTHLTFEEVAVGNCMLIPILLRNDGWVPCKWEASIRCEDICRSRDEIGPFFLHYNTDTFLPGYESVMNIYFKPKESKYSAGQLRIKIHESIFPVLVSLSGTGVEPKLLVFEDSLTFQTVLPYVQSEQRTFLVKNIGSYPLEVFWRNFDTTFIEEERVIRILSHYYGVDEILFPPRRPGEKLSPRVYDFYQNLCYEIREILDARKLGTAESFGGKTSIESGDIKSREKNDEVKVGEEDADKFQYEEVGSRMYNVSDISRHQMSEEIELSSSDHPNESIIQHIGHNSFSRDRWIKEFPQLPEDPDQMEALLHCYVDELREREDFSETMKDPMKGVFEDAELKSPSDDDSSQLTPFCIIFHGAPFTKYQEAACQVGKIIGISVLNINKAVTEVIALGNSSCSNKLREIVDQMYYELLSSSEIYRKKLNLDQIQSNFEDAYPPVISDRIVMHLNGSSLDDPSSSIGKERNAGENDADDGHISSERIVEDSDKIMKILLKSPLELDPLEEFNKIPQPDELKSMNPLDEYEYKIQSVLLLQKIISSAKAAEMKDSRKPQRNGRKKLDTDNTFPGITSDLIHQALKQRLSMQDFHAGFTVQTMDNIFVKNERDTLVMLLSIVGNARYLLFVTFHNTLNKYLLENEKLVAAEEMKTMEELERRLTAIEHMTRTEYDHISEDDKILYASKTLAAKRADSQRRGMIYNERLAQAKLDRKSSSTTKRASMHRSKISESIKTKTTLSETAKSLTLNSKEFDPTKTKQSTPVTGIKTSQGISNEGDARKKIHRLPKEFEEISALMDTYQMSLAALQPVLANWDPQKSTYIETAEKNRTPKSARMSNVVQQKNERKGIDVWYIAPVDPWNSQIYDKLASYLAENDDIQNVLRDMSLKAKSKMSLDSKMYSVPSQKSVSSSLSQSATPSDVYTLTSVMEVPAVGFDNFGDSARKVGPENSTSISIGRTVEELLKPRFIMQPEEVCKFKVYFAPEKVGVYKYRYNLSIVGSSVTRHVGITGSVDIPRLDMAPEVIFSKVEKSKLTDLNKPAYLLDTKIFDFGSIPLTNIQRKRIHHIREAKFRFSNTSTISATVAFFLMDNSDVYGIVPDLLTIAPTASDSLNVSAEVSKAGPNLGQLLLCIRNNPQVELIQLQSCGSKLEVELEGKVVSFDKILMRRKAKRTITVNNKSSVSLYWRLDFTGSLINSQVMLHPERGFVQPYGTGIIECNYSAESVGIMEKEIVTFQAYLEEHDTEPFITDFITITGETYDVKVDLINTNPIDFKSVKVGTLATETFLITNRGPYDIGFIFQPETLAILDQLKLNLPSTLSKDMYLGPASGSLSPEKPIIITVNFLPREEIDIFEAPLFKCRLIDSRQTPTTVAEFPILVSVKAHCAKVRIQPSRGLDFGPMAVFDKKTMYLHIENIGYFSSEYKINDLRKLDLPSRDTPFVLEDTNMKGRPEKKDKSGGLTESRKGTAAQFKTNNKTPRTTETTRRDENVPSLRVGPFVISRDEGKIEPGEVETIVVQCCPESVAIFTEEVEIFVPNTGTSRDQVEPIKLFVNGCIPTIDSNDLDAIFRENIIVDSLTDFSCPPELGPHSIYARNEKCLYFRRVSLSRTHITRLRIRNPGFVFSDVTVTFVSETNDPVHGDGRIDAFVVEPHKAKISPMFTQVFTVSFTPNILGSYVAVLNITLELPPPLKSPGIGFKVCGEGAVPEVVLVEPVTPYTNDQILMNFGRSLVGEVSYQLLSLKNVGTIEAKVIAEISRDASSLSLFTFEAKYDEDVAHQRDQVGDKRRIIRCLMPEEIVHVNVKFAPNEAGKSESRIDVFTMDNPYGKIGLVILGESYVADVILQGLGITENIHANSFSGKRSSRSRKGSKDSQLKSTSAVWTGFSTSITTYKLDYGSCFLNESKRICFKITNKSGKHFFRFEWGSHPNVVFSPSVGHLGEHESKDIIATFFASVPTVHTETQLKCTINEIDQLPGEMNEICREDRQRNAKWDAGESDLGTGDQIFTKVTESRLEPAGSYVVPGSTKTLQVMLCAVVAYAQYDCPIKEINFKDVLMFQSCKYTFVFANPGMVDMSYRFSLHMDNRYPMRLTTNDSALWNVSKSLKNPCRLRSRPKSRTLSGTLYPRDLENPKSSIIASSVADKVYKNAEIPGQNSGNPSDSLNSLAASNRTNVHVGWVESDCLPFQITPEAGVLLPGESTECTIVFSPMDVFRYQAHLTCRIYNLDPELPSLNVTITARSLLPYCHFDIPESDYLSGGKRNAVLLGPLMDGIDCPSVDSIRVVEFKAIGVGQTHFKKFRMINPTAEDYHFSWRECKTHCVEKMSYFDCIVAEGVAERGKQTEFTFSFLAKDVGVLESFWIFSIDRYKLETKFLFVAVVTEPSVYLIPGYLEIKPTVIGAKACASIMIFNRENIQLSFRIIPKSLYSDDRLQRLMVNPMSGTLEPNSEQRFKVQFQRASPGESEFFINCCIEKLKNPLIAIVSTKTHSIEPSVVRKNDDGNEQQIHCDGDNTIDCEKMNKGPDSEIFLKRIVRKPSYVLNFNTYDFGPSYINSGNVCHHSAKIHFTNNDETPCTLECKFNNVPYFWVDHEHLTGAVPGLSSVSISVKFIPLERVCYRETIRLLINSTTEENITILGEGIEYKVCLVNPQHKIIDLGDLFVGRSVTRKIPLINKGRAPLVLRIGLVGELLANLEDILHSESQGYEFHRNRCGSRIGTLIEQAQIPSAQEAQLPDFALTIDPSHPTILNPNGVIDIFVTYTPARRTGTFEDKVGCQMHETILPLFIIKGASVSAEFFLDKKFLSFGTVVEGCSREMNISLTNTGSIGSRFNWNIEKLMPHYNLVPRTGYCSPGMHVSFTITFSPTYRSNSIEGQATIDIENYETMSLTTSGACESFPEPVDTVYFSTQVRQSTFTDITLRNTTCDETWTLKPIVSGDFFTATSIFIVPPLKSNVCTVTYRPLSMITSGQTHKGTIYFKLPEGRGLLYALVGTSLPPEPAAKIFREFPARTRYTELLPVSNWLNKTQRFMCIIELLNDMKVSPIYSFLGNKAIDIPSGDQRDYRAVFYSHKEGTFHFRVTFKNDDAEYHHYEVQYKVTKPGLTDTIKLTTAVRTVACHLIKLENPLRNQSITYTIACPHPYISVSESSKLVHPESTEGVKIEFNPLIVLESMVKLDATCLELGTFSYGLCLKATPASPEKPVYVSAVLGSSTTLSIKINNSSKQSANFSLAIDDPSFSCGRNISIQGLGDGLISVTYEPYELRNVSATLTVTSQSAGDYIFPIIGTTIPPKPQGPFTVTPDRTTLIPFKNIFDGTKTFDFHVDAPDDFYIEHSSETIQSKKTVKIAVGLVSLDSSTKKRDIDGLAAGRLIVCSTEASLSRIKWIYYLKGAFK